jgi:hypothetical protein
MNGATLTTLRYIPSLALAVADRKRLFELVHRVREVSQGAHPAVGTHVEAKRAAFLHDACCCSTRHVLTTQHLSRPSSTLVQCRPPNVVRVNQWAAVSSATQVTAHPEPPAPPLRRRGQRTTAQRPRRHYPPPCRPSRVSKQFQLLRWIWMRRPRRLPQLPWPRRTELPLPPWLCPAPARCPARTAIATATATGRPRGCPSRRPWTHA